MDVEAHDLGATFRVAGHADLPHGGEPHVGCGLS
jgi:hypothetical protein